MAKAAKKIEVVQNKDEPVPAKILAESIRRVADSNRQMRTAGLTRRAIVTLLHDSSKVSKTEIERILDSLDDLEKNYLNR